MAAAVADLGLAMLRAQSATTGQAQRNAVVAPVSLASALGMVHAGVAGASADEIAGLLGAAPAWGTVFSRDYPALLGRLRSAGPALASANRIWVDASLVTGLPASYQAAVTGRYQSEGAVVSFSQPAAARKSINQWAADHTGQRIRELLPTDAITANTRVVLTNAMHFKSPWQQAFSPDATTPRPFYRSDLTAQNVPTMVKSMSVRMGRVDNVEIVEIPFASGAFALTVAMPPKGHTLNAFETDLSGQDMAAWSPQLHEARCRVELPRFAISPQSVALKEILKRMGMKTVFSPQADFSPMLGRKAGGIELDNVYQSAGIQVDENGSEAVAATAAVASFKSMPLDTPAVCAVNRPFVFAITHVPTGTPVFVGKVAQPAGL
jgi:serpin B